MRNLALAAIGLASFGLATGAHAASMITGPGEVTLDRTDDFSWTIDYTATAGTDLAGTSGSITFNFLSANATGTQWNFSYAVDNTSTAPSLDSRLIAFGFNTSGNESGITTGATDLFSAGLNAGNFNGLGVFDVCFWAGPNCNGGGGEGVAVGDAPVPGTFTLTLASGLDFLVIDDFVARWQSTGPTGAGSNSGPGTIVPEPATWAMFILGFAAVGYTLRRRRTYRLVQAV